MAYNAISLVTIDIVPTSQPLRHDKVVGDMQIVSISCRSVSQYIILRGGLGYWAAITRGSPHTQQIKTSIYRRQETYHILYNEFVMDREEDSIRYQMICYNNSFISYVRTILPFAPPYSPDNYNTKEYCAIQKVEQFIVYCVMKGSQHKVVLTLSPFLLLFLYFFSDISLLDINGNALKASLPLVTPNNTARIVSCVQMFNVCNNINAR